jgi:hypothetical protein
MSQPFLLVDNTVHLTLACPALHMEGRQVGVQAELVSLPTTLIALRNRDVNNCGLCVV